MTKGVNRSAMRWLAVTGVLATMIASTAIGSNRANALELIGLDHYAVNVHNLDAAAKWYSDVLGFSILHKWKGVTMVGKDNIKVGLFEQPNAKPLQNPDDNLVISHAAFLVDGDKFNDTLEEIRARGVKIDEGPEDTGIAYSFFFHDIDGNLLEITTYHGNGPPALVGASKNK
jgi:catechol 2,3-dioxygenase